MFRPAVAIIKYFTFETIKIVLYNSHDGVLMKKSQHQTPAGTYYPYKKR